MALQNLLGAIALDSSSQSLLTELQKKTNFSQTQQTTDTSDIEYVAVAYSVTAAGDNIVYSPAVGKKIRLHWVYTMNDPSSTTPAKITISLGGVVKYITFGVSKRQVDTGPIDGKLTINLSQAGSVACTFRLEEI